MIIHRKSLNPSSFRPSATLAKTISALVMLNFLPNKPVSATSLAQILMFMSTPLPPAKKQKAWYVALTPFTGFGGSRPSFQCLRTFVGFETPNFSA